MKKHFVYIVMMLLLVSLNPDPLRAGTKETEKIATATEALAEIMKIPEKGIPSSLFRNVYGIAVIPGVIKVGFVLGGRYGQGIMVTRSRQGIWSNPSFITITGGSLGWQIGAQSTDIVLVFKSRRSIDGIMKGKFTLGADAAIAAGPVGRQAEAGTDVQLKAEVYSYSRSRGLFAGVALEGAALQIDGEANAAFYGVNDIRVEDILDSGNVKAPSAAETFRQLIMKYVK